MELLSSLSPQHSYDFAIISIVLSQYDDVRRHLGVSFVHARHAGTHRNLITHCRQSVVALRLAGVDASFRFHSRLVPAYSASA